VSASSRSNWNFEVLIGFYKESRENRSTRRKTSWSKGENQQQTQPTYCVDAWVQTRATLAGGECSHICRCHFVSNFNRDAKEKFKFDT